MQIESRQESFFETAGLVAAAVYAGLDQEEIAWARTSRTPAASGHGGIGDLGLNKSSLSKRSDHGPAVRNARQCQGQLVSHVPGITEVRRRDMSVS